MKKFSKIEAVFLIIFLIMQAFIVENIKALEYNKNVVLLIDNSGSMQKTDPNKLSVVAASMLIDTADENTNLNIIAFGNNAASAYKLSDNPSREKLKEELKGLKFDNSNTSLKDGIKEALNQLEGLLGDSTIIVLSDGREEPIGGLTDSHMKELVSLSDKARDMKIKINCIGLSNYADEEALSDITFKTGGDYFPCNNPSDLFNIFSKILGNMNDFYTIEQFTTDTKREKEIKLSSYIEEVIIKVASCDNKSPKVEVALDGKNTSADKIEDKYKIYSFKNNKNSSIKITSKDEGKNSVIVQIKSTGQININSSNDNFSIPFKIPMNIEASLKMDKEIMGLHMDKLEDGKREGINKIENVFKFTFKKEEAGQYPVVITAYDGEGNIIAVKDLNINVKNQVPFYYSSELPDTIMAEESFKVELKQQDNSKVNNMFGQIYVDYGSSYEKFPLKFEGGALQAEVLLKKAGEVRITTQLNGVKDNEAFSYYLPYLKAQVLEKPYVEIDSQEYTQPVREGEQINLNLNIKKNLTYENENIFIYDEKNNKVGELKLTPGTIGHISIPVMLKEKGQNLSFMLRPEKDIKITDKLSTNLRVISEFSYFIYKAKVILVIVAALILMILLFIACGDFIYRRYIKNYSLSKTLYYKIGTGYSEKSLQLNLRAAKGENTRYLSVKNTSVSLEEENSDGTIGYFKLRYPTGIGFLEGWRFKLNKGKSFSVEYVIMEAQEVFLNNEAIAGKVVYKSGIEIKLKQGKSNITISFS
jgi:uncharacterized protein YegL